MKKIVMSVFILALGLNSLVYAQDVVTDQPNQTGRKSRISAGAGLLLGGEFYKEDLEYIDGNIWDRTGTDTYKVNTFDIGLFGFLDATYVEANLSAYYGSRKNSNDIPGSMVCLNLGILGKYPFQLNKIRLFPLLGIDYAILLSYEWDGRKLADEHLSRNNAIWIKAGGGFDYPLSQHVFLRGELLWGIKLKSKAEKENEKIFGYTWDPETQESVPVEIGTRSYFTHGPTIKIGIGYAF